MEQEGDSPAPRPAPAPGSTPTQNLQFTPENVVTLAAMFRDCVDELEPVAAHVDDDMLLEDRWMDDPVSEWTRQRFNEYFVHDKTSFAKVVRAEYEQHKAMRDALKATALQYGLTEELRAAGFTDIGKAE